MIKNIQGDVSWQSTFIVLDDYWWQMGYLLPWMMEPELFNFNFQLQFAPIDKKMPSTRMINEAKVF